MNCLEKKREITNRLNRLSKRNMIMDSLKSELANVKGTSFEEEVNERIKLFINEISEIRNAIDNIKNVDAQLVIKLKYINNLSVTEIAHKLGVSYTWVRNLHCKGVNSLICNM